MKECKLPIYKQNVVYKWVSIFWSKVAGNLGWFVNRLIMDKFPPEQHGINTSGVAAIWMSVNGHYY